MAFTRNYYELLGVGIDADNDSIKASYNEKIQSATDDMGEKYKTAYYTLTDEVRREKYDLSLGIHKYRKVPWIYKSGRVFARFILTVADAVLTFYWCIIAALVLFTFVYLFWRAALQDYVSVPFDIDTLSPTVMRIMLMLAPLGIIDKLIHYHVRRANRYLKHYKFEYSVKNKKK